MLWVEMYTNTDLPEQLLINQKTFQVYMMIKHYYFVPQNIWK